MYKVYQDPEGTGCLEQSATVVVNKTAISSETDEVYKKNIEGLNRRIKTLRDELKKVACCSIITSTVLVTSCVHFFSVV